MCGIFGIIFDDGTTVPEQGRLEQSVALLAHRGPDGRGTYREPGIGLGHTRLSLLDLSTASEQPFWDPTRRFCLIYNGEIYNFRELRDDLKRRGAAFHTTGDTEVLLQSLIVDGARATLDRVQGMFAFAFYDRQERHLLLARDRFGIKPLVAYRDSHRLIFSSEVKALMPWVTPRTNPEPMLRYLCGFESWNENPLFYENIQHVPPGAVITVDLGQAPIHDSFATLSDYLDVATRQDFEDMSNERIVDRFEELLDQSVTTIGRADAPIGALCSGGVDSSLICTMAAHRHGNLALFHANVVGPFSEQGAARRLAQHLKLDLISTDVTDQDFIDLMPAVIRHYEHPFPLMPHAIPFLKVARLARDNGVKAVLSGEGADECFLGYRFLSSRWHRRPVRKAIIGIGGALRRVLGQRWHVSQLGDRPMALIADLVKNDRELRETLHRLDRHQIVTGGSHHRSQLSLNLLQTLLRVLLHRNDRMGMAANIEARFPFLHEPMIRSAINLPNKYKLRFGLARGQSNHPNVRDKLVLREVADRYMPRDLSQRTKRAFRVDAYSRIRIPPRYFADSYAAERLGASQRDFAAYLENSRQIERVRLLMFDLWGRICIDGAEPEEMTAMLRRHITY